MEHPSRRRRNRPRRKREGLSRGNTRGRPSRCSPLFFLRTRRSRRAWHGVPGPAPEGPLGVPRRASRVPKSGPLRRARGAGIGAPMGRVPQRTSGDSGGDGGDGRSWGAIELPSLNYQFDDAASSLGEMPSSGPSSHTSVTMAKRPCGRVRREQPRAIFSSSPLGIDGFRANRAGVQIIIEATHMPLNVRGTRN